MPKTKRPPVHRPHLPKVRAVPEPVKCLWFATVPAYRCERTGYRRVLGETGAQLCDVHFTAAQQDIDDWDPAVRRVRD